MAFPLFHYNSDRDNRQEPPLTIFIAHRDTTRAGFWRPEAFVVVRQSLRTSGFLLVLPPEELQTLLLLLTFISPSGHCAATLGQLASALRLSRAKMRARMARLLAFRWLGQPLIVSFETSNDLQSFILAPGFVPIREEKSTAPAPASVKAVPREIIIEHSRRTYGRPRAEVEHQIAEMNEWKLPDAVAASPKAEPVGPDEAAVRRELLQVGLLPEQADELLARFDLARIQRQLLWLPYRTVRNRAGFLLAAIKDSYDAPLNFPESSSQPDAQRTQSVSTQSATTEVETHEP